MLFNKQSEIVKIVCMTPQQGGVTQGTKQQRENTSEQTQTTKHLNKKRVPSPWWKTQNWVAPYI